MTQQTDKNNWTIPTVGETNNWGEVLNAFFDDELDEDFYNLEQDFNSHDHSGDTLNPNDVSISGNPSMHTGVWDKVDVGTIKVDSTLTAPYTESITTGFEPAYIEFYGNRHTAAVGTEFDSGDNTGEDNAISKSEGYASGSAASDQAVSSLGAGSNSSNGHLTYVGEGDVVYLITTDGTNSVVNGRGVANIASFDTDGFTLEWTSNYENYTVIYRAYK